MKTVHANRDLELALTTTFLCVAVIKPLANQMHFMLLLKWNCNIFLPVGVRMP